MGIPSYIQYGIRHDTYVDFIMNHIGDDWFEIRDDLALVRARFARLRWAWFGEIGRLKLAYSIISNSDTKYASGAEEGVEFEKEIDEEVQYIRGNIERLKQCYAIHKQFMEGNVK